MPRDAEDETGNSDDQRSDLASMTCSPSDVDGGHLQHIYGLQPLRSVHVLIGALQLSKGETRCPTIDYASILTGQ